MSMTSYINFFIILDLCIRFSKLIVNKTIKKDLEKLAFIKQNF